MEPPRSILIAGAGIGGLVAALALARQGRPISILERFKEPSEVGAGLQLSPNATRILFRLGLEDQLRDQSHRPEAIRLIGGRNVQQIAEVPLGDKAEARWGAPYLTIHRGRLHALLWEAVEATDSITIETDSAVMQAGIDAVGPRLRAAAEDRWAYLVIGADGVRSTVRACLKGGRPARYTGQVAFRGLLTGEEALVKAQQAGIEGDAVSAFLSPGVHLVAYPLGNRNGINLVAHMAAPDPGEGWSRNISTGDVRTCLSRIAPELGELADVTSWQSWGIHAVPPRSAMVDAGGIALVGDAAHAMTPFAAQGAAMAIEDAVVLARCLGNWRDDRRAALMQYEAERRPRLARVRRRGAFNKFVWHAGFPVSLGRDMVLRARRSDAMLADFDWLYGHDAGA